MKNIIKLIPIVGIIITFLIKIGSFSKINLISLLLGMAIAIFIFLIDEILKNKIN